MTKIGNVYQLYRPASVEGSRLKQGVLIGEAANSARESIRIPPIVIGGKKRCTMRAYRMFRLNGRAKLSRIVFLALSLKLSWINGALSTLNVGTVMATLIEAKPYKGRRLGIHSKGGLGCIYSKMACQYLEVFAASHVLNLCTKHSSGIFPILGTCLSVRR